MNIVVSSHSLHSQSSSTGRLGEPRNAKQPGMMCVWQGHGGWARVSGAVVEHSLHRPRLASTSHELQAGQGTRRRRQTEVKAQGQSRTPAVCPGPSSRSHVLFHPFLPAAGCPLLTSTYFPSFCLLYLPELCELLNRVCTAKVSIRRGVVLAWQVAEGQERGSWGRDHLQRWGPGGRLHLLSQVPAGAWNSTLGFVLLNLYVWFCKNRLLVNLYLEGHAKLFSGDVLERVTDSENRYLGRLGNKTEERDLLLEKRQEEWKAKNILRSRFIVHSGGAPRVPLTKYSLGTYCGVFGIVPIQGPYCWRKDAGVEKEQNRSVPAPMALAQFKPLVFIVSISDLKTQ